MSETDFSNVNLPQLKAVICRLIDEFMKETGSENFQLPIADFYHIIPPEKKMVSAGEPTIFHVGGLSDDWEMVHWLADEPTKVSAYALTAVAPLLDFMGHSLVQKS